MEQFQNISTSYAQFVERDPFRNLLHYPAVIEQLGKIDGKRILDVGCGDGRLARILAGTKGAHVSGYDSAEGQIKVARAQEEQEQHGIQYQVARPETYAIDDRFDLATSVMVLPYADSEEYLQVFFNATSLSLKQGGSFISIIFNPDFDAFNEIIGSRRFVKYDNRKVEVEFIDTSNRQVSFTSQLNQFSRDCYQTACMKGGFSKSTWLPLSPTQEVRETLGMNKSERAQPYALFVAELD